MPLPTLDGDNNDKRKNSLPSMPPIGNEGGSNRSLPNFENEGESSNQLPNFEEEDSHTRESEQRLPEENFPEEDFSEMPVSSAISGYEEEELQKNGDVYQEIENIEEEESRKALPSTKVPEETSIMEEDDYNPDYEKDLEELKKDKYVDKKNKKIVPFGGKKSKKKFVKSSDFDDRKNNLAKTKMTQFFILVVIAVLFLVGLKNTFLPAHVYSDDQIRQFAAEGAGKTGFPDERGRSFVENFMNSYLSIDDSKPEQLDILGGFYGKSKTENQSFGETNMTWSNHSKQKVLISPKVYEAELLSDHSAQYKLNAYVSNTDGSVVNGEKSAGRWLSFSVNVYYDAENDTLSITPDSPSLVPSYKISKPADVPERAPYGNGNVNAEILPALTPTINGFVEAYAKSSRDSHESIIQYIDDKNDISLYDGFGGAVMLDGDPTDAIQKVVYDSDDGIYRVIVTVKWVDTAAAKDDYQVGYTSRYIMRIKPIEGGKYAVSSFVPYTYFKK